MCSPSVLLTPLQPGHEYTTANAKFGVSVLPSEAVKSLAAFAKDNAETQGKFTIGDEKEHNVFMRPQVGIRPCAVRALPAG